MMFLSCTKTKIVYRTKYVKIRIECTVPDKAVLKSVDKETNIYKKILVIRNNILALNKVIAKWRVYNACVERQSKK